MKLLKILAALFRDFGRRMSENGTPYKAGDEMTEDDAWDYAIK